MNQTSETILANEVTPTGSRLFDRAGFEATLRIAKVRGASDVHISGNGKVAIRVNGTLEFLDFDYVPSQAAEEILMSLIADEDMRTRLREDKEHDFCYTHSDGTNYRCNAYFKNGHPSISMRRINDDIPTLETLGVPEKIRDLVQKKQGLIFVCGPTGHGKTTTLAAMVDEMNKTRDEHILTIEDPIEYVFESKRCMISQRELHTDTRSFDRSLRAAMRQDPDIIIVGEVRDRETAEAVFNLVATGHLVITTVHATNAAQTLYRIARMFSPSERDMVLSQMADSLLGILNQRLVPTTDGSRVAIFELLTANWASRNAIRNGDVAQLLNTIMTSTHDGMVAFEHSAARLIENGRVRVEHVLPFLEREPMLQVFA